MELCDIREETTDEVPDSIIDTSSNVNFAQDESAPLVNTVVAAGSVLVGALDGGNLTTLGADSFPSDSKIIVLIDIYSSSTK